MIGAFLQTVAAFNLVCSGTTGTIDMERPFAPMADPNPVSITYRIDLQEGRWCSNDCTSTKPIYQVTSTQIVLEYSEDAPDHFHWLERETGRFVNRLTLFPRMLMTRGECTRSDFTGFPPLRF